MAMEIDFLFRLLGQLVDVYAVCEERKKQCERKCHIFKQLLKPWPPAKTTTGAAHQGQTQAPTGGKPTDEELAMLNPELQKADKLLARAQTLIEKQNAKTHSKENDAVKVSSTDSEPQQSLASHPTKPKGKGTSGRSASAVRISSSSSQNSLASSTNKNNPQRRGSDGMAALNSKASRSDSGKATGVISQSKVNKLLGQTGRSASTKSIHVHMRAPFQTQSQPSTHTRRQRPNSNKPRSASSQVTPAGTKHEVRKPNNLGSAPRDSVKRNPDPKYCKQNQTPKTETSERLEVAEVEKTLCSEPKPSEVVFDMDRAQAVEDAVEGLTKIQLGDTTQTSKPEGMFNLKYHGNTLSLPAKLRRAYACNRRLRQKAMQSVLTVNVKKKSDAADEFLQSVENSFFHGCDGPRGQLFQRAALMCGAFTHLRHLLESLSRCSISKNSNWVEVLHAKRTAEFVIHSSKSLKSEYLQLLKDLNCGQTTLPPSRVPFPHPHRIDVWLPEPLRKVKLPGACNLQYTHPRQMETYIQLLHEAQLLQLQLVVMDTIAKEMLPYLDSMDPADKLYKCLYRSVYSLLCCDGIGMPALVQDSIANSTPEPDLNDF